jgi:diguanylate cyclase (GGDEF)-like protein
MIDIDHFKRFNDQFGHDAGDMVMQYVGQVLRSAVADIGNAFRFGGEEFTILLPDCSEEHGFEFAEKLRAQIGGAALSYSGQIIGAVTVSIGVAVSPAEGAVDTLVSRADAALLDAKAKGRNKTVLASNLSRRSQETLRA